MSDPIGRSSGHYIRRDLFNIMLDDLYGIAKWPAVDQEEELAKHVWAIIEKWEEIKRDDWNDPD